MVRYKCRSVFQSRKPIIVAEKGIQCFSNKWPGSWNVFTIRPKLKSKCIYEENILILIAHFLTKNLKFSGQLVTKKCSLGSSTELSTIC